MSDTYRPGGYQGYDSYGSLDWRRRIALEMMKKQQAYPKNVGEGIASAGGSLADALIAKQQREAEREYAGYERGVAGGLPPADTPYAPRGATAAAVATPTSGTGAPAVAKNFFANLPNSLQEQEDQYPYGKIPSFNGASEEQPAPMPTPVPAATDERVPLPPPRPVYDRNRQIAEIEADPSLKPRLLAMARGEVGPDPAKQRVQLETAFNRATARDQSLDQILLDTRTNPRLGYYPAQTFTRGQASEDVLTPVLRGSDEGGVALGFSPTGNASGDVAASGVRRGYYTEAGKLPGDAETYVQHRPDNIARLEATRVPGSPLNIRPQAAGGIESGPRTFGGPYAQAAPAPAPSGEVPFLSAGGLPARDAITSAMVPPPTPPIRTAALPSTTATDAAPERSALPPNATAQAEPRNPIITTDAVKKAPETLPSQEPIPQAAPPYVTEVPPAPKRPQPLGMSDAQAQAHAVMNNPRLDPQGAAVRRATQVYNFQEGLRKELETQQQAEFTRLQAQRDAIIVKKEQRAFEEQGKILKEHIDRVGLEKAQSDLEEAYYKRGVPRQQAAEQARLDILKAGREVRKPETFEAQGTRFERQFDEQGRPIGEFAVPPGAPAPEKKALTTEQAKAVTFVRDVLPDMDLLETKLNHGMVLAKSPFSAAGSTIGGLVGLGNVLRTDEYQQADNAIGRFKGAVMQHLSGAAVSPSEAERNLPAFIPRLGDSEAEVLRKSERRRNYVNAVASTAGAGGDSIEAGRKMIMETNGELPVVTVKSLDELKTLGAGQRVILPDGNPGRVPWPKHLLPK